jgi:CBS domain-containing protein
MDEWIEDDIACQAGADTAERILDRRMLREPIHRLEPRKPVTLPMQATLDDAIRVMRGNRIGCVLIVDGARLTGILTERDLLLKTDGTDPERPVRDLMTPDPEVLSPSDPIVFAINKMSVGGFRHVPLVDGVGRPVGVISVKDIVDYLADVFADVVLTVPPNTARAGLWQGRDGG